MQCMVADRKMSTSPSKRPTSRDSIASISSTVSQKHSLAKVQNTHKATASAISGTEDAKYSKHNIQTTTRLGDGNRRITKNAHNVRIDAPSTSYKASSTLKDKANDSRASSVMTARSGNKPEIRIDGSDDSRASSVMTARSGNKPEIRIDGSDDSRSSSVMTARSGIKPEIRIDGSDDSRASSVMTARSGIKPEIRIDGSDNQQTNNDNIQESEPIAEFTSMHMTGEEPDVKSNYVTPVHYSVMQDHSYINYNNHGARTEFDRMDTSDMSPRSSGPPTPVDIPLQMPDSIPESPVPHSARPDTSVSLHLRSNSTMSGSTFGGQSRAPSVQRVSNLSMQSMVEITIETPQPEHLDENHPHTDVIRKSLFQAARKCDFQSTSKLLGEWKNLELNFTDDMGKTLLHHCTNSGDRTNVDILLQRGAQPNKVDKSGLTPLHYAAKKDHVDIIEMLVVHGASLDFPEAKTGQTAIHFAVMKNYLSSVQILMFSGADAGIKDKQGRTPLTFCRSKEMRTLLSMNGGHSGHGNSFGEVHIQTIDVQGGQKIYCDRLDVTLDFTTCAVNDKFSMMCRRQSIEVSDARFHLKDNEEIFSDVITYRLPRKGQPTPTAISLPLFGRLGVNEELMLKSNQGHLVDVTSLSEENAIHYCHVTADISKFDAFVIISRVKHDAFNISAEAVTVTSSVNRKLQISFPEGAVEEPTKVHLEITNAPNPDIFESSDMADVYSVTPFCRLYTEDHSGPKRLIQIKLPLPAEYGVGGNIRVFTSNVYEIDDVNENSWSIIENKQCTKDSVSFNTRSYSIKCAVETKKDVDVDRLRRQVHKLFLKARLREYSTGFITMVKQIGTSDEFRVIVECCPIDVIEEHKTKWLQEGYDDQTLLSSPVIVRSKQSFRICPGKNLKNACDVDDLLLQFHPKRRNFVCLAVTLPNSTKHLNGNIQIQEALPEQEADNPEESKKTKPKTIKQLSVEFSKINEFKMDTSIVMAPIPDKSRDRPLSEMSRAPSVLQNRRVSSRGIDYAKEAKGDPSFKGFTDDAFLREMTTEMDNEWYKIAVLMGWSYSFVERVIEDPGGSQAEKIWHFFLQWRNINRSRDDLGMAALVTAFSKGGRRDLCTTVQLKMREWSSMECNQKSKFYRWVVKAFKDPDLMNPGDYPCPISDQFLVLLVENTRAQFEVVEALGIPQADIDRVMSEHNCPVPEQKMLKLLLMSRDLIGDRKECLMRLIQVLERTHIISGKRWIIMACTKWLEDNKNKGDPFCSELQDFLSKVN